MTSRKPPSKLDRLLKSHLKLLRAFRHQTNELGELRKVILEMRPKPHTEVDKDGRTWHGQAVWPPQGPEYEEARMAYFKEQIAQAWAPNDWPRL